VAAVHDLDELEPGVGPLGVVENLVYDDPGERRTGGENEPQE
jgi:hypothetical protein